MKQAFLSKDKSRIDIKFSINDTKAWTATKEAIKAIPGRKFVPEEKKWTCPLTIDAIRKLAGLGFELSRELYEFYERTSVSSRDAKEMEVPGFGKNLYPFQKKGVWFIEKKGGRALVADEMGLGKTLQALGWFYLHPEARPAVIVCPASVKLKWEREVKECIYADAQVLYGRTPYKTDCDILIINYDVLDGWLEYFLDLDPKVIVLDECHYIKNYRTKRAKCVAELVRNKPVIGLSGTPVMNNPRESYNIIKTIELSIFRNFRFFEETYCSGGNSALYKLHEKLIDTIMIRRRKEEVLKDLPPKVRGTVPIEINSSDMEEYEEIENGLYDVFEKYDDFDSMYSGGQTLAVLNAMRKKAGEIKLPGIVSWIKDFLDCDGKLVVFAHHRNVVESIHKAFPNSVMLYGGMDANKREQAVQLFQNDPSVRLFVGNIKAAGIGIDLTASSNVAFAELPWTPADITQAEDRCHRIGQNDSVNVFYMLASDTIDDRMMEVLNNKQLIVDAVLDGKEIETNETIIKELLKSYWRQFRKPSRYDYASKLNKIFNLEKNGLVIEA